MADPNIDQMISHLEFLGYEVEVGAPDEDGKPFIMARHPRRSNFVLHGFLEGFMFRLYYSTNESTKEKHAEFLEYINSLNRCALITRAFCDEENDLVLEAWLPSKYDKVSFGQFLEYWDNDVGGNLAGDERTEGFLV